MIENFLVNPPEQELVVEKIEPIKKIDSGKKYQQLQQIADYKNLPKNVNFNRLGPDIYAVMELNDDCNGNRYILYYNEENEDFFYFDRKTNQIVADNKDKIKHTEPKDMDISNIDLENPKQVKLDIMDELTYKEQSEDLGISPLEKLKRAYLEVGHDSKNVIGNMKKILEEDKFPTKAPYFSANEIKKLNELSNNELNDETLKLDCPKRSTKKCKNGFTIKYDLPERFGKKCPYLVCNDLSFFHKYKKGLIILMLISLLIIVILVSI